MSSKSNVHDGDRASPETLKGVEAIMQSANEIRSRPERVFQATLEDIKLREKQGQHVPSSTERALEQAKEDFLAVERAHNPRDPNTGRNRIPRGSLATEVQSVADRTATANSPHHKPLAAVQLDEALLKN